MESERIIEILEAVKELLKDEKYKSGICGVLNIVNFIKVDIRMSFEELREVEIFLRKNKPTRTNIYKEFIPTDSYFNYHNFGYWWLPIFTAPETRQIRIDYLTALISNIK